MTSQYGSVFEKVQTFVQQLTSTSINRTIDHTISLPNFLSSLPLNDLSILASNNQIEPGNLSVNQLFDQLTRLIEQNNLKLPDNASTQSNTSMNDQTTDHSTSQLHEPAKVQSADQQTIPSIKPSVDPHFQKQVLASFEKSIDPSASHLSDKSANPITPLLAAFQQEIATDLLCLAAQSSYEPKTDTTKSSRKRLRASSDRVIASHADRDAQSTNQSASQPMSDISDIQPDQFEGSVSSQSSSHNASVNQSCSTDQRTKKRHGGQFKLSADRLKDYARFYTQVTSLEPMSQANNQSDDVSIDQSIKQLDDLTSDHALHLFAGIHGVTGWRVPRRDLLLSLLTHLQQQQLKRPDELTVNQSTPTRTTKRVIQATALNRSNCPEVSKQSIARSKQQPINRVVQFKHTLAKLKEYEKVYHQMEDYFGDDFNSPSPMQSNRLSTAPSTAPLQSIHQSIDPSNRSADLDLPDVATKRLRAIEHAQQQPAKQLDNRTDHDSIKQTSTSYSNQDKNHELTPENLVSLFPLGKLRLMASVHEFSYYGKGPVDLARSIYQTIKQTNLELVCFMTPHEYLEKIELINRSGEELTGQLTDRSSNQSDVRSSKGSRQHKDRSIIHSINYSSQCTEDSSDVSSDESSGVSSSDLSSSQSDHSDFENDLFNESNFPPIDWNIVPSLHHSVEQSATKQPADQTISDLGEVNNQPTNSLFSGRSKRKMSAVVLDT